MAFCFLLLDSAEKAFNFTDVFAAFFDFVFCLICGFSLFSLTLRFCSGNIRGYLLLGAFLGALIFALSIGKYVADAFLALLKMLFEMVKELFRLLFLPFGYTKMLICRFIKIFSKKFHKFAKKVLINRKIRLKNRAE